MVWGGVMWVGVPKEVKIHEYRVGLTPAGARELVRRGHEVTVETGAGEGAGITDAEYAAAGARVVASPAEVFAASEFIVKVKEPQPPECELLRPQQTVFAFLHLAADPGQAAALVASGATAIGYETVTAPDGSLPLLTPMSEIAGRMAVQVGAHCLEKAQGGRGVLLGGVPGVESGQVVILGGGVAGTEAALMAAGLGAEVTVVDRSLARLRELSARHGGRVKTVHSTHEAIARLITEADLVIGSVLVPGAATPKLVTRAMLGSVRPGAVLVDIAIDQGGCFETSRPTSHAAPSFVLDGIVHYCVTNMPGAVPRTSTLALTHATLPYVLSLAEHGAREACRRDPGLAAGVNVEAGRIVHAAVAGALQKQRDAGMNGPG